MKKLAAVLIIMLALGLGLSFTRLAAQEENTPAPAFTLKDLQGNLVSLSDYKGKVLVLNFWATWCPPCRQEIPDFIEAYQDLKSKGLEILGLSVDHISPEKLKAWGESNGINYPLAVATGKVLRDYHPGEYIPATIIIDKNSHIRHRHVGAMDKDTLLQLFKELSN